MQTIRKWHWANRRARCWHVTTHNGKENGRNIRKWIEKMSAPCTCAPLYIAPPLSLWQGNLDWKQVENLLLLLCCLDWGQVAVCAVLCCAVCVWKFFEWFVPITDAKCCAHTHAHTSCSCGIVCLFCLDTHTSCAVHNQSRRLFPLSPLPPYYPSLKLIKICADAALPFNEHKSISCCQPSEASSLFLA